MGKRNIILGSQSPRRQSLLREMGIEFVMGENLNIDEKYPEVLVNEEIALFLAELKFDAYKSRLKNNDMLITADTIVCFDSHVLGKPNDRQHSIEMLALLSGKTHSVYTGVCVGTSERRLSAFDRTDVTFRCLELSEIESYVDRCKPFDKAGSYGIQEWVGYVGVERISGSFYNVMGLPTHLIYALLKEFDD